MLHGGKEGRIGCYVCDEPGVYSSLHDAVLCWKHVEELLAGEE